MITNARNKKMNYRDQVIIGKGVKGFSPTEIGVLLEREGFAPVTRSRIDQVLKENGVDWRNQKQS